MSIARIYQYYRELEEIETYSGQTKELSIKRCFANLLNEYAKTKKYNLVEEVTIIGINKKPDGCIFSPEKARMGYWEAKDAKDNLEKELQNKINIGYPTFNLIIENSETLYLIQDNQTQKIDMKNAKELDKILIQFINYEIAEVKNFKEALAQFIIEVPKVVKILEKMIVEQLTTNTEFQSKRKDFFTLCQIAINPKISYHNIDEMLIQHILTEEIFLSVMGNAIFHEENNISKTLISIEKTFFVKDTKRETLNSLKNYYTSIKSWATSLITYQEKQDFLKLIYESFYKAYFITIHF